MVKSKRAREATETATADPTATVVNGTEQEDKKIKKRKRDTDDAVVADTVDDEKTAKKVKKDKKDKKDKKKISKESRKEKKDKRKDLQDLPDLPEDEAKEEDVDEPVQTTQKAGKSDDDKDQAKLAKKKEKKDKKKKRKAESATNGQAPSTLDTTAVSTDAPTEPTNGDATDQIDLDSTAADKKDRHIVFVGNLPFSATAASISAHFATLSPIAVRCLRNKDDPNPCRGIAFVEFGKVWHQRTCLDKFHHSMFDDGVSPARRINVELT